MGLLRCTIVVAAISVLLIVFEIVSTPNAIKAAASCAFLATLLIVAMIYKESATSWNNYWHQRNKTDE